MGCLRSGSILSGVGAVAVAIIVCACSATSSGDLTRNDNIKLPERGPEQRTDAGAESLPAPETPPPPEVPPPPPREGMDAGADGPPPRSAFCSEAGLVLCFEFEQSTKDSSVNGLDPATTQGVSFTPGHAGYAAELAGTSAIRLDYSPLLNVTALTIEAWVNLAPNVSGKSVVFDADDRYSMEIESNGDLKCIAAGGSETGGTVVKGTFTHVACTIDSNGKIRNYVGGVERDTGSGRLATSNTGTAAVGGNAPSGDPFVGAIDSLRVFGVVRTAAEIAQAAQ